MSPGKQSFESVKRGNRCTVIIQVSQDTEPRFGGLFFQRWLRRGCLSSFVQVSRETELIGLVELYSEDGLETFISNTGSPAQSFRSLGRQSIYQEVELYESVGLTLKDVLQRAVPFDTGEAALYDHCQVSQQSSLNLCGSFIRKAVMKRPFVSDSGESPQDQELIDPVRYFHLGGGLGKVIC